MSLLSVPHKRLIPALLAGALAAALAVLLVAERYRLETTRDLLQQHVQLEHLGAALSAELERGAQVALRHSEEHGWQSWQLDESGYHDATGHIPPVAEAALRRALSARHATNGSLSLLGPFATERGDALVFAGVSPHGWAGSWRLLDGLLANAGIVDFLRQGLRLELYDAGNAVAIYRSDPAALLATAAVRLRIGDTQLEVRAAPREGFRVPLRVLSPALLVVMAVLLWAGSELRRGATLRVAAADLTEAEARRRELNLKYSDALASLGALESRLNLVSTYDTVTGLPNRASLNRHIEGALDAMRQSKQGALTVMAIGVDHLRQVTETFGSEFASRLLVIVAERLEFVLPSKELLFRIGDHQLAAVLSGSDANRCEEIAQRMVSEVESPIGLDSHTFLLRPGIGIAQATSGYEYAESIVDHAATALAALARDAPIRWCRFDSAAARESVTRLQLEVDLGRAFEQDELVLEYEPFVVPATRRVAGFEALVRWNHPTEGRLMPGRFVPIALQSGLSHRLNNWVIREAARQAAVWRQQGQEELFINFNLSAEAFLRPNLADEVAAVLAEFELPGQMLVVELTESTLIQDLRSAARTLQRLSELGIGAWLDDFGTGYSSLSHLRSLPLKAVKIDRSFVERIEVDSRDFGFLKALIDLITYLGMQSVAEGIETEAQYELLGLTACDLIQGHYFAHSLSATAAADYLRNANGPVKRAALA